MSSTTTHDTPVYDRRGFWALFIVMIQGAFNDNVLRFVMTYMLVAQATPGLLIFGRPATEDWILGVGTVIFALPFILFPGLFGSIADRYSKRSVAIFAKLFELVLMLLAIVAFSIGHWAILFGLLFLMTTQSALFGPAKYGILPESLPESMLSWANGSSPWARWWPRLRGGLAGPLYNYSAEALYLAGILLAVLSAIGVVVAYFITPLKPANPTLRISANPWAGLGQYFKVIWSDRILFHVVVGYIYFWFAGQVVQNNVTKLNLSVLKLGEMANSIALAMTVLGIGSGSLAAGFLSRRRIELGLVPIGAAGLAIFGTLLSFAEFGYNGMVAMMFGIGFWAGFFDVPLAASLQHRSPKWAKGGIMATSNMLTFFGMLMGGVLFWLFGDMGISPYGIFLFIGVFSILVAGT
ncbi:MAG: MFS transporter [Candidatus Competibacteraceae bacterium]|nr:MFS transporter [Candidatus Competibacteraceae bacterium]